MGGDVCVWLGRGVTNNTWLMISVESTLLQRERDRVGKGDGERKVGNFRNTFYLSQYENNVYMAQCNIKVS